MVIASRSSADGGGGGGGDAVDVVAEVGEEGLNELFLTSKVSATTI